MVYSKVWPCFSSGEKEHSDYLSSPFCFDMCGNTRIGFIVRSFLIKELYEQTREFGTE